MCLLALMVCLLPATVRADAGDDAYTVAAGFYKKERWDLATTEFQKFLQKYGQHPRAANARFFLGMAQINLDDYKGARDTFRTFLKDAAENRNAAHAMYRVAECSYLIDDLTAAETELAAYLTKFPTDELADRALPYLADCQLRRNKPDLALQTFQQAIQKYPEGPLQEDCWFGIAKCHEAQKQPAAALKIYEQLAADTKTVRADEAQLNVGSRLYDLQKYTEAAAAFASLEQKFPESELLPLAHLNHGFSLFEVAQFAPAQAQFELAAKDPTQTVEANYWRGQSLKGLGQFGPAADLLQQQYLASPTHALAANLLYHWADAEQRRGQPEVAQAKFLELADKFPKHELADDALHLASAAALDKGDLATAEKLTTRFATEFPSSGLRWHQELIRGRLQLGRKETAAAVPLFQKILQESQNETTQNWAAFYLGFAQLELGQPAESLNATTKLAELATQPDPLQTFAPVFLIRGAAQLALANQEPIANQQRVLYQAAIDSAGAYLERMPTAAEADQALAIRALAAAHSGLKDRTQADVKELLDKHPKSAELDKTLVEVAEVAYSNEDWDWSAELFEQLLARGRDGKFYVAGLSGRAWSQYQRKDYVTAGPLFQQVVTDFPEHKDAAEAAFMTGKCLALAGDQPGALQAYAAAFAKYLPSKSAYLAGLEQARLQRVSQDYKGSDATYTVLLEKYPSPEHLDKVLNEWALMNYEAENFARSDEIFARLVREAPDSDLADNAQLSLAESELIAGKLDAAREKFVALEKSPKSDEQVQQTALYQLIGITLEKKDWPELRTVCQALVERFPASPQRSYAELHWAEADLQTEQLPAAAERLAKLTAQKEDATIAAAPWFPQAWVLLAEAQFRQKKYEEIERLVAECRAWQPEWPALYLLDEVLGRSLNAQAKFPEAQAAFERVIDSPTGRRTETAAKSQFMIAEILLRQKKFAEAEAEYLKVDILYKFPAWQAPALLQAGACQEELKRFPEAAKTYQALIDQHPTTDYAKQAMQRLLVVKTKS